MRLTQHARYYGDRLHFWLVDKPSIRQAKATNAGHDILLRHQADVHPTTSIRKPSKLAKELGAELSKREASLSFSGLGTLRVSDVTDQSDNGDACLTFIARQLMSIKADVEPGLTEMPGARKPSQLQRLRDKDRREGQPDKQQKRARETYWKAMKSSSLLVVDSLPQWSQIPLRDLAYPDCPAIPDGVWNGAGDRR